MLTIGVSTTSTTSSVTDMNKAELIDAYAQQVLDNMDMKTLEMYAYDMLVQCFEDYTEEELITEVGDHYPELLEGWLMQFQITKIFFDLSPEDPDWENNDINEYQKDLQEDYIGTIWEADDEDDLVEEITCASNWLIDEIDYRIILK